MAYTLGKDKYNQNAVLPMTRRAFRISFLAGVALILFYIFGFYFLSGRDRALSRSGGGFSGSGLLSGFFAPMTSIDRRLEANRDLLHSHGEWTFSGVASGDAFTGSLKVDPHYDYVFSVQTADDPVSLQKLSGYNFNGAVWVGYIALFGTAVQTGAVMVVYLEETVKARMAEIGEAFNSVDLMQAVKDGARLRLRPKVMTVATIVASLLPIMWSHRQGSEVMKSLQLGSTVAPD
jgi:hypothetical protein